MTRPALARIDDLTIDFTRRKIFRGKNKVISLSTLSFNTLHALVESAPAPLTAKELIEHAWQGSVVSDDTVTQRIRLIIAFWVPLGGIETRIPTDTALFD